MQALFVVLVVVLLGSLVINIFAVGKPRKPVTAGDAVISGIIQVALVIWIVAVWPRS